MHKKRKLDESSDFDEEKEEPMDLEEGPTFKIIGQETFVPTKKIK